MILININTGPHPPGLDELQPDTAIGWLFNYLYNIKDIPGDFFIILQSLSQKVLTILKFILFFNIGFILYF